MDSSSGTGRAYSSSRSDRFNKSSPEVLESTYDAWQNVRDVSNGNQRQHQFRFENFDITNDETQTAINANNDNEERDEEILEITHDEWHKARNVSKVKAKQREASPEIYEITAGMWRKNVSENDAKQNEVYPGSLASIKQEMRDLESYMSDEAHAQTLPATDKEWAILQEQLGQWSSSSV